MINSIKNFLFNLKPDILIQAPSRINLINPLDAVEGDFWAPSVAITGKDNPLSAFVYIKKINNESKIKTYTCKKNGQKYSFELINEETLSIQKKLIKKNLNGPNKLVYASIYRFSKMNSFFKTAFSKINVEIGLITTIPLQSGLGGSAAIIVAILYGLAKYFKVYNNKNILKIKEFPINRDIIAEIATKIEDEDLNITSGYGDRYVISRGGLCFCSYYGKIYHKGLSKEPLAVYDRIDFVYGIDDIPLIVCYSGVFHESGDIHRKLRSAYLQNNPKIINSYSKLAEISWKSRFAIMCQDWRKLGRYFKTNTKILNDVMEEVGFKYGIGLANNILIDIIEEHPEVYAAKLTGAGGGGSVFALVNPSKVEIILKYWKKRLKELVNNKDLFSSKFPFYPLEIIGKLKDAQFFRIEIDKKGVKKL